MFITRNSQPPAPFEASPRVPALALALLVGLALTLGPTRNAMARDLLGTRATGMSGALRASALGPASIYLNPAGMSLANMYVISGLYQYRGSDSASQMSVAVVDSATTRRIAAGLFYNFTHATPEFLAVGPDGAVGVEQTNNTHEVGAALSMPLGEYLFLGVSTRYINLSSSLSEKAPPLPTPDISTLTMDVGGIVRFGSMLNLAVVGYNLIPVDKDFSHLYPQALGLGLSFSLGTTFLAEFDTVIDFTSDKTKKATASFHGGAELFLGQSYAFRAGAAHDMFREATYISTGLSLVTKRLGLEFGLRQQVDGGAETLLAFSLNLFVQ